MSRPPEASFSTPASPDSTLAFRIATPADAARISVFARRLFEEEFGPNNTAHDMAMYLPNAFSEDRQTTELSDPSRRYLLGEHDGELAAYTLLRVGSTDSAVDGPNPVEIERFYVDAPWQGRGEAQRMMQQVMALARQLGGETLWLGVWERNARAIRFYEKHGFVDVGSHPYLLGTDWQTDRVMSQPLADQP